MKNSRKLALITGASSGIGEAFARLAVQNGYDVALVARREERLRALAEQLAGVQSHVWPVDLCSDNAHDHLAARISETGRTVDILINNAGYSIPPAFANSTLSDQRRYLELSVNGPVALAHYCLGGMLEKGWGRIINVSSITAFSTGGKGHTLYPASKSFIVKFSQSLNAEVSEKGVHVTAVCPGFVDTEFQKANNMADKMASTPKFLMQSAQEVAEEAWRRNEYGVEVVVPGILPKIAAALMKLIPEQITTPLTRRAAAKYYIGD